MSIDGKELKPIKRWHVAGYIGSIIIVSILAFFSHSFTTKEALSKPNFAFWVMILILIIIVAILKQYEVLQGSKETVTDDG